MKNQKWIWIGLAVVAILGLVYWYFTKTQKSLGDGSEMETMTTYTTPGNANSINELSPECQKKFESWAAWMKKNPTGDWMVKLTEQSKSTNTPINKVLENNFLWQYNTSAVTC